MADSPASTGAESPAQEKARLRRERRAAKMADGAARLQAITSIQGISNRDVEKDVPLKPRATPIPSSKPTPTPSRTDTPDPDEIDISSHAYTPASQPRLPSPFAFEGGPSRPFPGFPGATNARTEQIPDPSQDPMMAMLQQMMGSAGATGQGGQPDLPPGLANMFQTMQGGGPQSEPEPSQSSAWIWRLVHSIFALALSIYIVVQTPFTGSKAARSAISADSDDWTLDSSPEDNFKHFFYLFATSEVILQSSRYFIEKGQLQGSGILSSIGAFLPEPYAGYVRVIGRYSVIYSTVVSDAMVVVFVLGASSWWRGVVIS